MGRLPPDAPLKAELTGFPLLDSASDAEGMVAPALRTFLDSGSAPLVFTLGSVAVASPGSFYEEASAATRMLGRRAVMLTGQPGPPRLDGDCLFMGYAPHSAVFPYAEAVVHHGGIGTTGQALRAGRPQIVVPHYGDQFDNAARLQRAGVGSIIPREEFERVRATAVISRVLADATMKKVARSAADQISNEDGAARAAAIISGLV